MLDTKLLRKHPSEIAHLLNTRFNEVDYGSLIYNILLWDTSLRTERNTLQACVEYQNKLQDEMLGLRKNKQPVSEIIINSLKSNKNYIKFYNESIKEYEDKIRSTMLELPNIPMIDYTDLNLLIKDTQPIIKSGKLCRSINGWKACFMCWYDGMYAEKWNNF